MTKRALISVSDKAGIVEFAQELKKLGWDIISTGGTKVALDNAGVDTIAIDDVTGFPEMMDGRVKTLHPNIHGGLLARRDLDSHLQAAKDNNIELIDLVVVNLYPFKETILKPDVTYADAVENIDIGGPSMLRSAAKNHASVTVVVDPADYAVVLDELAANGETSYETRQRLAAKVFRHTAAYDALIAEYFTAQVGEEKPEKANEYFSLIVYTTIIGGLILSILGMFLVRPVSILLGAEGELLENCVLYGRITFISLTAFMLQNVFQSFFVTATKPKLGLAVIVSAGVTNMVLDYLFIAVLGFGLAGAAIATVCGELIGGLFPIFYFSRENSSLLKLGRTKFNGSILLKTCTNGSSELMTNLSSSVVNSLYNIQLLKFTGEDGVAAYGTIMYVSFIFVAIFIGYSIGSAPIISYNYGSGNNKELQNMSKKSLSLISIWAVGLFVLAQVISTPLATIFVGYDHDLFLLTRHGFRIYCVTFLINGFNIYGSAFFTALSNGLISATISFLRTLIFQIAAILILPAIFGINGIWFAVAMAELLTLCFTATFFITQRKVYHY